MGRTIPCSRGCPPPQTGLGSASTTVTWKYTTGQGSITNITGLPNPPFSNPRADGSDFKIDYAGAQRPPNQSWTYKLSSSPACPTKTEEAQLTNGPG